MAILLIFQQSLLQYQSGTPVVGLSLYSRRRRFGKMGVGPIQAGSMYGGHSTVHAGWREAHHCKHWSTINNFKYLQSIEITETVHIIRSATAVNMECKCQGFNFSLCLHCSVGQTQGKVSTVEGVNSLVTLHRKQDQHYHNCDVHLRLKDQNSKHNFIL